MVEAINKIVVVAEKGGHQLGVPGPEIGETALAGGGEGAMHKHQHRSPGFSRLHGVDGGLKLEGCQPLRLQGIDPFVDTVIQLLGQLEGYQLLGPTLEANDIDHFEQPIPQPPPLAAGVHQRSALHAVPPQFGGDLHFLRSHLKFGFACRSAADSP
ncbi:MAG: hypothetical protein ACK5QQ_01835 [Cyanobacteriota bacterium]|nr:hypothetical protein [Cyanobium sp. 49614_E6]